MALAGLIACAAILSWFLFDIGQLLAGVTDSLSHMIREGQRHFHTELAAAIRAVQQDRELALWNLGLLGFAYGVFHAAGPGHGKFIISTYIATSGARLSRGLALTGTSSLVQGLAAIVAVEGTVGLLNLTFRDARQFAGWLETASYSLVALVGIGVSAAALLRLRSRLIPRLRSDIKQGGEFRAAHRHDAAACAGHHPAPTAELDQPLTLSRFLSIVLSVGLRPCTGAVLILLFAVALDLRVAGYGAVVGISLGTALTVSGLAILAVYARRAALALFAGGNRPGRLAANALDLVALAGGLLIAAIGLSLFANAWGAVSHPLL